MAQDCALRAKHSLPAFNIHAPAERGRAKCDIRMVDEDPDVDLHGALDAR